MVRICSNQGLCSLRAIQIKTRVNSLMVRRRKPRETDRTEREKEKEKKEREKSVCKEVFVPLPYARGYKVEARWDAELPTFSPLRGHRQSCYCVNEEIFFSFFLKVKRSRFHQRACNNASRFVSLDKLLHCPRSDRGVFSA